jgi:hypothetical protein
MRKNQGAGALRYAADDRGPLLEASDPRLLYKVARPHDPAAVGRSVGVEVVEELAVGRQVRALLAVARHHPDVGAEAAEAGRATPSPCGRSRNGRGSTEPVGRLAHHERIRLDDEARVPPARAASAAAACAMDGRTRSRSARRMDLGSRLPAPALRHAEGVA